jgi:hypothetical protein
MRRRGQGRGGNAETMMVVDCDRLRSRFVRGSEPGVNRFLKQQVEVDPDLMESPDRMKILAKTKSWSEFFKLIRTEPIVSSMAHLKLFCHPV